MKKSYFNKIIIIQSLSDSDLHTGTKIKEDLETYTAAFSLNLDIELIDVDSKKEFFAVLIDLENQARLKGTIPILHIDAHGCTDQNGIIFSSGDYCDWIDLKPYLISINVATKLYLIVVFSLCYGAHFTEYLAPPDRAPCWGMVGPTKAVGSGYLLNSFSVFYREILETGDGSEAVRKLNKSIDGKSTDYFFTTAADFFINLYQRYIEKLCTDKEYANRARKMRKQLKKNNIQQLPSIGSLRRNLKKTQKDIFEKYKKNFFMIDVFPENASRFNIEYSDVL